MLCVIDAWAYIEHEGRRQHGPRDRCGGDKDNRGGCVLDSGLVRYRRHRLGGVVLRRDRQRAAGQDGLTLEVDTLCVHKHMKIEVECKLGAGSAYHPSPSPQHAPRGSA